MTDESEVFPDYFRVNFEDDGRCLSFNAVVSSAESMTRLIEMIRVCRSHMVSDATLGIDEAVRTLLEPQSTPTLKDLP